MMAHDIASRLDLKKAGRNWRGNCPCCGYKASFILSLREDRVRGHCVSCDDWHAIAALITDLGGGGSPAIADAQLAAPDLSFADRVAKAMRTWSGAVSVANTPADTYLASRGIPDLAVSPALRWRTDVRHPEVQGMHPAMLVLLQDGTGQHQAVHRHYLQLDGRKAPFTPAKATAGPLRGAFAMLDAIAPEMVIGEGLESSASAGALFSLPALAGIAAGNLARLELPSAIRSIVIAADNDEVDRQGRRAGQTAAYAAASRWVAEGRRVRVALPDREGVDFNDILLERLGVVVMHG